MDLNIADVALLEAVLSEEELVLHNINTSSLKIGVPRAYLFDGLDPDMTKVMENMHAKLMAEGRKRYIATGFGVLNEKFGFSVVFCETGQLS